MTNKITHENLSDVNDDATYAVFYIDNLRTRTMRQYAYAAGTDIRQIFANTSEPRRVVAIEQSGE